MSTPRPPAALIAARKSHAEAKTRVQRIDEEIQNLRGAIAAADRAHQSAKGSLRAGGKIAPALAQAVGERHVLSAVLADEENALAEALRALTDAEAELANHERTHALACAAVAERALVPRVVAALAALHELAGDLDAATSDATRGARNPHTRSYSWMQNDQTRPHQLHATVHEAWDEARRRVAWKLTDMGLDDAAQSVRKGTA